MSAAPPARLRRVVALLLACALLVAGCGPEATRQRGERGGDPGNRARNEPVEIHGRTDPGWSTPLRGRASDVPGAVGTKQGDITGGPGDEGATAQ